MFSFSVFFVVVCTIFMCAVFLWAPEHLCDHGLVFDISLCAESINQSINVALGSLELEIDRAKKKKIVKSRPFPYCSRIVRRYPSMDTVAFASVSNKRCTCRRSSTRALRTSLPSSTPSSSCTSSSLSFSARASSQTLIPSSTSFFRFVDISKDVLIESYRGLWRMV